MKYVPRHVSHNVPINANLISLFSRYVSACSTTAVTMPFSNLPPIKNQDPSYQTYIATELGSIKLSL